MLPAASVAKTVTSNSPSAYPLRSNVPPGGHGPVHSVWKYLATVQVSDAPGSVPRPNVGVTSLDGFAGGDTVGATGAVVSSTYVAEPALLVLPAASVTVTVNV